MEAITTGNIASTPIGNNAIARGPASTMTGLARPLESDLPAAPTTPQAKLWTVIDQTNWEDPRNNKIDVTRTTSQMEVAGGKILAVTTTVTVRDRQEPKVTVAESQVFVPNACCAEPCPCPTEKASKPKAAKAEPTPTK